MTFATIKAKSMIVTVLFVLLIIEISVDAQTCVPMWDPIFETNPTNPPTMCDVATTNGTTCRFPFNYGGVTYKTCTIQGPNNSNRVPRCAITINLNRTAVDWSDCIVPTDASVTYATVRKDGYTSQNGGSTQGGTMLWIYGQRFADNGFSSTPGVSNTNTVQLVDGYSVYNCEMHNDKTTSTQLTCYVPALPDSVYQVRVYVNGLLIPLYQYNNPAQAFFIPMSSQTPTITGISPSSGTPQSLLQLTGSFKTSCYSRDVEGCAQDNNPLISRIFIGGHLCNLVDSSTGETYANVSSISLQCNFEGTEVGVFNVSMLISNEYGRALVSPSLYRVSATETLYNIQSYAVVTNATPNAGSTAGGTTITITGNFFSDSTRYPLVVKVGGEPCTILSSSLTTIQCQTSAVPSSIRSQYHGGRGLQIFRSSTSNTQSALSGVNPPTPSSAAVAWTDDALYIGTSSSVETVWLIGFVRVAKAGTYTFSLDTNGAAAIFLSTNDDPANKVLVAQASSNQTNPVVLQNNTDYYLFCVGSRSSSLRLGVQARLHETKLTAGTSSLVQNEIQRITVTASVVSEQQQLVYTPANSTNGTSEVQSLAVDPSTFQIGFRGVYTAIQTGRPTAVALQAALNDLPTIYPLRVTVAATSSLYTITFPAEMGDVPLLTCISSSLNSPNVTEVTAGVDSGSKIAFALDGQLTDYIDFVNTNVTQAALRQAFNNIFSIQCPPSINDQTATPSIAYIQDFESNCVYDETPITTQAFCGQCSYNGNSLVSSNIASGHILCFAYRVLNQYVTSIGLVVQINGDSSSTVSTTINFSPKADLLWHYTCIDIRSTLISQSTISSTVSQLLIQDAWLNYNIKSGIFLDTISIRTALPVGYEDSSSYPVDQSANSSCVFPFNLNGNSYTACTLNSNNIPVCANALNQTFQCQSSSIEGVRRLYPKHQLVSNSLQVTYVPLTATITVAFRYSTCTAPTLFVAWPSTSTTVTRLNTASSGASGTFDLVFNNRIYPSIPVNILPTNLANLLQSSSDFGYLNVKRTGDCTGYTYTIEWIANGGAKSTIAINNTNSVTPVGTTVTASRLQSGGVFFKPLSGDLTRTYNINPQIEVLVGGYPSQCVGTSTCDFQWLSAQTPTVTSISQSSTTLTITGTGFSTTPGSNTVIIGTSGSCTVTSATATSLTCTIAAAPAGTYPVQVNVDGKGLATGASSFTANVNLAATGIAPITGGAGGGYLLNINGTGFSSFSVVTIDGNVCKNPTVTNFASISCTVPPSSVNSNTPVNVVVTSGSSSSTSPTQFTYDVTNTPTITSFTPSVVTMAGGVLNITGTNFGTTLATVLVGTTRATVRSTTSTQIFATLPSLAPGIYPVYVITTNGYARPAVSVEYRFYVQSVTPQVGSLFGGSDVYIRGQGFDGTTSVAFSDSNNNIPCNILSYQSDMIHCRTGPAAPTATISATGVDPTYGAGFAWSPQYATVQQGAIVQWQWGSSSLLNSLSYKVVQVANSQSIGLVAGGFDSGNATSSGSFSYQFSTVGTYYFYTPPVDQGGQISMRGVINVVAAQPRVMTVAVKSGSFAAQSCAFPFVFNSISYSACTTVNDTQQWCSPTATYTGQRLYCTPTATVPASSCVSSSLINIGSCSQTAPTSSIDFLFTPCNMGTVTSISPVRGPAGTSITITGTGFSTTTCENSVLIGSSYQCPITSATTTQIVCQIGSNSLLSASAVQNVFITKDRQGFHSNNGRIQFQFQAKITNISPTQGSTAGGTVVIISGDGFTPENTRIILGSEEYTLSANISYSQIRITTGIPPQLYINQNIPVSILVGTNPAVCSTSSCTYQWADSVTPSLNTVSPSSVSGPQTLTLTGQNLNPTGSVSLANIHVAINGRPCNVTAATNSTIQCTIESLPVGNYSIATSIDGVGKVISSPILTSNAAVSSVSPISGGTNGGVLLTINGNGFPRTTTGLQVQVGSGTCSIVQTSPSQIQCTTPPQGSSPSTSNIVITANGLAFPGSFTFSYSSGLTPTISSINPTSGVSGQTLTITGTNFVNSQTTVNVGGVGCTIVTVSSTTITCTLGSSQAGSLSVVATVAGAGRSNGNVLFQYNLQVTSVTPSRGSFGGGQLLTIAGDGFNGSSVTVTICGQACQSVSVLSNTQLTCRTPARTVQSSDESCTLVVNVGSLSQNLPYIYQANVTATVTNVSPSRGGTGGGTTVTITGTNFVTTSGAITVSIAGVACTVQSASATTITCTTGAYSGTTIQAPVIVTLGTAGAAIGSSQFQYIDLWSSPWTWGGLSPPEEGTIVSIDGGKTIYFDTTTPILKALVVDNATLIFDDMQNVALNAEYILLINGGRLQVGTESSPFQHRAVITMYGHLRSIELPIFGAKVLAIRDGSLDMHGIPMIQTWARLASTAAIGATQITLQQSVNWPVGSKIVIATTGDYLSQGQTETRTITVIGSNNRTLTLDSPLTYRHLGVSQTFGATTVDIRGEVGLLSHNVVFRGSTESTWNTTIEACPDGFDPGEFAVQTCFLGRYGQEMGSDQFGATIMASGSSMNPSAPQTVTVRLSNIEVTNAGQAFRLGRYPVHFHMNGNMNQSYIKSSSIHSTFNRAVNIHATNYLTVENNVIYNIMGGAMFLEDGVEIGNKIRYNLAVFVRTSSSLLNEDVTPAAFWVTNPNNIVEHNAVAGGTHFGYWYRMLRTPDGPSFANFPNFCPYRQQFGRFFNNSVHSVGRFGVWVFPEYSPTTGSSCWGDNPFQAVFDGLVAWGNNRGFESVMSSTTQVRNAIVFDNHDTGIRCVTGINHQAVNLVNLRSTFYNENTGSSVINSVVIGDTGNQGSAIVPGEGGLVVMWDRGLRVRNVSFFNFPNANTQAIYGPIITGRCSIYCGGWLTKFSHLSFNNVARRGKFRWAYDGLYQDEDGSLGGTANTILVAPDALWNTSSSCSVTPNFVNSITCPVSLGTWIRFAFNNANLGRNGEVLNVYDSFNRHTVVLNLAKRLTHKKGYMMNLLAQRTYLFQFQNANSTVNLSYTGVAYSFAPGDYLIISHQVSYIPDRVYTTNDLVLASASLTPITAASNNGEWFYDNSTSMFTYIVKNPSTNNVAIDIPIQLNVIKCRYPNCQPPAQPGLELPAVSRPSTALYWSNDSHWSFTVDGINVVVSQKPAANSDVYIPRGIWMVIDYPLPAIRSLRIDGVLEFEQGINNTLSADSILINGGQLIAGWPNNPLTSKVDIVITGSSSVNVLLPNGAGSIGPRVIGVLGGLDLHGITRNVTWTRLAITAVAGQNSITLSEPVDWVIGDEIILTTTSTRINHVERHTIAGINVGRTVITLAHVLANSHVVIHEVFPNGQVYHIAAAVGLLTHNVRVINRSPASELFGFRILVTDYATNVWYPVTSEYIETYYKGYARISNTQFIGFGQFVDAPDEDKREAFHLYNLGDWNSSRPTYIDSCSFDGGYYSAIGIWSTNGVPITNNVVYNTYESGIVAAGTNNIIQKNLVSTIYWSGAAQPQYAEFCVNHDGAITTNKATSVVVRDNLVSGVDQLAYRIQGNACPGTVIPSTIDNDYDNNEAHSASSGANLWPMDKGFDYDQDCVLIKGFKTYKTYHYGIYINTPRNIIIDSCSLADGYVGIFTLVMSPAALSHVAGDNYVIVRNSFIAGAITQNDCSDTRDLTTINSQWNTKAIPGVADTDTSGEPLARVGIAFPYFTGDNMMPKHAYASIGAYPAIEGVMTVSNVTMAYFNDVCSRHDIAIRIAQQNDDGSHPVNTDHMSVYNSSQGNRVFNGRPNLGVVNPSDCVDMDCDALKKGLLIDTDGTFLGSSPSTVFSQAEYNWGNQAHGIGDYRIPRVVLSNLTGSMLNINLTYPFRGIARAPGCTYQPSWQMYFCPNTSDYRMLIIESMDADTETRRLSPVAVMSNGFLDLINGPQDHGWCNGYTCQKRVSTFMSIIQARQHSDVYLTSTTPNHMRFRLLNSDSSIIATLGLYYNSLQQVDVYANDVYVNPTNRNPSFSSILMLTDNPSNVSLNAPPGTNYFNRTTQMAIFVIRGDSVIDLKISELIVLAFNIPATTPAQFYTTNVLANLAALLGVSQDKIRRVNIISATNDTRVRRQIQTIQLRVELREDPPRNLSTNNGSSAQSTLNMNAQIINLFQSGILQERWRNNNDTNGLVPVSMTVQEPLNQTSVELRIIDRVALIVPPSSCREQSPCDVQPVLVAYDALGNVIQKLGSNDQPWQVVGSVVGQPNITVLGSIANYTDGQTRYTRFGISTLGSYQFEFRFISPTGVSSSFVFNATLMANTSTVAVSTAVLAAKQSGIVSVVSINQTFDISAVIIDQRSQVPVANIQWRNFTWTASASLYNLPQHNSNGSLISTSSSAIIINTVSGVITASNLSISAVGMYMIQIQINSSNSQYALTALSSGILVKNSSTTLQSETGFPTSYITFTCPNCASLDTNTLETRRAAIYNYLRSLGLELASDLVLTPGTDTLIASFIPRTTSPSSISTAVTTLRTTGASSITGLTVSNVVINGRSYTADSTSSSSGSGSSGSSSTNDNSNNSNSNSNNNNTGLIVGLVVGLVGAAVLVTVSIFSYKQYQTKKKGTRLFNEPYVQPPPANNPPASSNNGNNVTRPKSVTPPQSNINERLIHSPLPNESTQTRVPSATVSINMVDNITASRGPSAMGLTQVELIKFD